jgi:hypothetical protein
MISERVVASPLIKAKHGKKWSHVAMRIHTDRAKEAAVVSLP